MTRYPTEIKQQVYEKFLWGHTAKELTEEFSVPLSTVYVWCGNWKKELAVKALADIPLEDMGKLLLHMKEQKQRLDTVEQELSIIHESGIIRTIPTAKRIDIALSYSGPYSDAVLSRALEVNKTTLFRHKTATKPSKRQQQEDFLSNEILTVYKKSGCRFGAERIRIQLQKQGICTSKKRIIRLMKRLRLYCTDKQSTYYSDEVSTPQLEELDVKIL